MGMVLNLLRVKQNELNSFLKKPDLLEEFIYQENGELNCIDLDKSWDGLIFLLTGGTYRNNHDLNRIFFSCSFIDEEQDLGYGPAHYLSIKEVKEYAMKLSSINLNDLEENYNPSKMDKDDVYPSGIWERDGNSGKEYLIEYFEILRDFYLEAKKEEQAIITFIG